VVLFIGLPVLIGALVHPASGPVGTFTPTQVQRTVPAHGGYVSQRRDCYGANTTDASSIPVVAITYSDDGRVFDVDPGGRVTVIYPYGRPLFSPNSPLCPDSGRDSVGHAYYVAASSGSGFVYIPEPTGTIVDEIDITPSQSIPVLFVVLALAIFALDITLTISMKRSMPERTS